MSDKIQYVYLGVGSDPRGSAQLDVRGRSSAQLDVRGATQEIGWRTMNGWTVQQRFVAVRDGGMVSLVSVATGSGSVWAVYHGINSY